MTLTVKIRSTGLDRFDSVHRWRNFGEEVCRWCRAEGLAEASLEEIDRSIDCLYLRNIKKRMARRVVTHVQEIASEHYFSGEQISYELT